jgi:hypothetical protein
MDSYIPVDGPAETNTDKVGSSFTPVSGSRRAESRT